MIKRLVGRPCRAFLWVSGLIHALCELSPRFTKNAENERHRLLGELTANGKKGEKMDDFLHNLRSGKLKQPDRGRRDYSDYKGPQRRAGSERRRTDYYAKVTGEHFSMVKDALDSLADQQKRIADALYRRSDAESRIAEVLEAIAVMLGNHLNVDVPLSKAHAADDGTVHSRVSETAPKAPAKATAKHSGTGEKKDNGHLSNLQEIIADMRESGDGWEKIARHLVEQKIPTVSGKGIWRGPAVKKFWESHTHKGQSK